MEDLVRTGVDLPQAREAVDSALLLLSDLHRAAASSEAAPVPMAGEGLAQLTLLIAGVAVQLRLSKSLVGDIQEAFGHLIADVQRTDAQLCVRLDGSRVEFLAPGQPEWSGEALHFVSLLKAELIDIVLRCARYEVALHAAAVTDIDGTLLLVGSPGAGKTTLSVALAGAGFEVISDDVVLVGEGGRATGLPFALTAKATAWPFISGQWPNLTFEPSYLRPDGQTVAYLNEIPLAQPKSRRIKFIILLDRQEIAPARVHEIDPVDALTALIAEGATRDERMSAIGFKSLIDVLQQARCFRLTYSDLSAAVAAVRSLRS